MITMKEIAKRAGVSSTTISRVLNNSGYVSEAARDRILKIIEETGYIPSEHAKSLRTKKTNVIGVILPRMGTGTSSRIINGMNSVLAEEGYQILLANTNLEKEKEIEYVKLLKSRQVDGIVLLATNLDEQLQEAVKELKIPFVAIGQEFPGVPSVIYNDYEAARQVTSLFIEKGHRKIAFIGVDEADRAVGFHRKTGYMDAMKEKNLLHSADWIQTGIFDIQSGYEAMKRLMKLGSSSPTAVLAVTDRLAVGAMTYLKEAGYAVPSDVALAGMGASELALYVSPPLTTVDFHNERAGAEAARIILNELQGKNQKPEKVTLSAGLIQRDSI